MANLKNLKEIKNLKNKTVILRTDFNCPIKKGKVVDDTRIKKSFPTIKYLLAQKARVILISHLGRPQGEKNKQDSLKPVAKILEEKFKNFQFISTPIGSGLKKELADNKNKLILLENIRFYPREEKNCSRFAKKIADLGDIYINDAFAVSHRAHSSIVAITKYLPSFAGLELAQEKEKLEKVFQEPDHPFIVLMGGKKIKTKIKPIKKLLKNADQVLIGGALASIFLKVRGYQISKSFYQSEMIKAALGLIKKNKIRIPVDVKIKIGEKILEKDVDKLQEIKSKFEIFDIGQKTIKEFEKYLKSAKIIIWNGPLGYFEDKRFSQGTRKIAQTILKNKEAQIIIGGGDTISALNSFDLRADYQNVFISSGGGAMLDFFTKKTLPGIKPLIK